MSPFAGTTRQFFGPRSRRPAARRRTSVAAGWEGRMRQRSGQSQRDVNEQQRDFGFALRMPGRRATERQCDRHGHERVPVVFQRKTHRDVDLEMEGRELQQASKARYPDNEKPATCKSKVK